MQVRKFLSLIQRKSLRRASGFTLLELVLVLLIMGVAAALVGPAVGSRLLRADARRTSVQIRSAMDLMRVRAIRSAQEEVLIVDPRDNTYWHERSQNVVEVSPESGILSARSRWMRENGQAEFHFYPDGTNSGGAIRVEQGRGNAMNAYVIFLDPLLGVASIWRDE